MGGKTVGKYDLYHTLGEGAYAKVKFAVNKETKETVAIKILDKEKIQQQNMGAQLKKEIGIMKMVHHEHLVVVKDVFATQKKIFLVLELVEGGELFDKIANEGKLSEARARFYFKQLVNGLLYCHGLGICHRDLKPENLLLDANGNLKISDFGVSTLTVGDAEAEGEQRAELLRTTCGTPNYVAPEVLANKGYDGKKADVWSCGVILFVLVAGYLPFEEATMVAIFKKIKHAEFSYPSWFSPELKQLLSKILIPDPEVRLSLLEISRNAWLMKPVDVPPPCITPNSRMQPKDLGEAQQAADSDEDINTSKAKVPNPRGRRPTDKLVIQTGSKENSPDKPGQKKRPSHSPSPSNAATNGTPKAKAKVPEEDRMASPVTSEAPQVPHKRASNTIVASPPESPPEPPAPSPPEHVAAVAKRVSPRASAKAVSPVFPVAPAPASVPAPVSRPSPVAVPEAPAPAHAPSPTYAAAPAPAHAPSPTYAAAPAPAPAHAPSPTYAPAPTPSPTHAPAAAAAPQLSIPVTHHVQHHQHVSPTSSVSSPVPQAPAPIPQPLPPQQQQPQQQPQQQQPQQFGQQQFGQQYPNQQQYQQMSFQSPNQQQFGNQQYPNQQHPNQQQQYPNQYMPQQYNPNQQQQYTQGMNVPPQQQGEYLDDSEHHPFAGGCPCNLFGMLFGGDDPPPMGSPRLQN